MDFVDTDIAGVSDNNMAACIAADNSAAAPAGIAAGLDNMAHTAAAGTAAEDTDMMEAE